MENEYSKEEEEAIVQKQAEGFRADYEEYKKSSMKIDGWFQWCEHEYSKFYEDEKGRLYVCHIDVEEPREDCIISIYYVDLMRVDDCWGLGNGRQATDLSEAMRLGNAMINPENIRREEAEIDAHILRGKFK